MMATRLTTAFGLIAAVCLQEGAASSVCAEDWMFRPSYHTHAPVPYEWQVPGPYSRSAYRRAYIGVGPGFAIRGGWRYNTIVLQSGSSRDVTIQRENWFEAFP